MRRRESKHSPPLQASYKTSPRRSRPTSCSASPAKSTFITRPKPTILAPSRIVKVAPGMTAACSGLRIVHQFGLGFDGFANANLVRARDEYHSEIRLSNFVSNENCLPLFRVTDDDVWPIFSGRASN